MTEPAGEAGPKQATLYLIAHRAHGVASFDVAEQLACPECKEVPHILDGDSEPYVGCDECDGLGFWWIGATSGWRMYPWWSCELNRMSFQDDTGIYDVWLRVPPMPLTARNLHNPLERSSEPAKPSGLLAALGLVKKSEPIKRRI